MNDGNQRNNVRVIREAIGMTQQSLADSAGLSQGYIHQVETGASRPSPRVRAAIAAALEVNELLAFPAPVLEPAELAGRER
jgi:transcriptional regulator with XRE-family HTH domain